MLPWHFPKQIFKDKSLMNVIKNSVEAIFEKREAMARANEEERYDALGAIEKLHMRYKAFRVRNPLTP